MIICLFGILSDLDFMATEETVQALNSFFLISHFFVTVKHVGMRLEFD